jgi:hypothetical protein
VQSVPPFLKKKKVWIPGVMALLVGLYALAGFLWAPKLLRSALLDGIQKNTGLTAQVGEIRVNPFLLQLQVRDFTLPGEAGAKLLGFERLFIDFEVSSLWHRAFVFQAIEIEGPYAYAVVSPDGRLNLAALKPKSEAPAPAPAPKKADGPLPAIRIASFSMSRGVASYEDRSRPDRFSAKLDPISFELKDFTTGVEGGRFKFTGTSKLGERLQWQGHLLLQPLEADGAFQIAGLRAQTLWDYLRGQVGFFVNSGSIDLNGDYKFALRARPELHVNLAQVSLKDLGIRPDEHAEDWISVPKLIVTATDFDLGKRALRVDSVAIDGAKLKTWLEPDGSFNLLRLARRPPAAATQPPAPVPTGSDSSAAAPPAAAPWQVNLREFAVTGADIALQDRSTAPAAQFAVVPLNLKVTGISLDLSKPLDVTLDAGINEGGHVAVAGVLTPSPFGTDLKINAGGLPLNAVQPYLAQRTALTLLDGRLNADGKLQYAVAANAVAANAVAANAVAASNSPRPAARGAAKSASKKQPLMQFAGNVSIDKLHTIDNQLRRDFISWNRLQIKDINFQKSPDRLDIDEILANKLYARVLIEPDHSLNVARILAGPKGLPQDAAPANAEPAGKAAPESKSKSNGKPARAAKSAAAPAGTASAGPPAAPAMPISIHKILVQAGNANFTDLSVQPNFSAGIQALDGSVSGLSSRPGSRAKVDLHGQVNRFSPVAIQGEISVLGPALYTDLSMSFRNMELTTFNPYSGKFAGYNISKGKLTTELSYKIDGRKLNAGHHITIDQLEFGEKTASKDAVTLPLKLAVALLKDRHGVIDLDVPVTGSLDDPQFRLGPIIWKVVVNLLVKIVTSPFALLGSLFGGGPDMQFVDFPAGIAILDPAAQAKVKTIAKALIERPQLKISVPLAAVPDLDRPALVEARLHDSIQAQQRLMAPHRKGAQEQQSPPPFESLAIAAQLELLTALYKKEFGSSPKFPPAAPEKDGAADAKADVKAANLEFLRQSLLGHFSVTDQEVKALAQQRAEAIQQVLLTDTQIDPARVFLVANGKAKAQAHLVRLELALE